MIMTSFYFSIGGMLALVLYGVCLLYTSYATVLNNLAGTYRLAGKYEEAADLFNESALIYSTTIGKDNSYYCSILNNLALVYQDMKEYDKAEEMLTDALKSVSYTHLSEQELEAQKYDLTYVELDPEGDI